MFSTAGEYSIEVNSSNYASSIVTQYIKGPIIDFNWYDYNNTNAWFTFSLAIGATLPITIQKSTDAGATWSIATTTGTALTASSTAAVVTDLLPNTNYKFKLVVADGIRAGDSNIVDIRTDGNMQDFAVYDYDNTTATFTFSAPGAGTTSVAIQYSTDYGVTWGNVPMPGITETTTQAAITYLSPNTDYIFRMHITGGYNAGYSNWWRTTTESNLQTFAYTGVTSNSASFTFPAPEGATAVKIIQYNGINWSTSHLSNALNAASTTATVVDLVPNTTYVFQLYVEGGTYPGYSNMLAVTTAATGVGLQFP